MRNLSSAALASLNAAQTGEVWLTCLSIRHAQITPGGAIYVVNDMQDLTRTISGQSVTFVAFPFQLILPGEDPDQQVSAHLRIDNVDQRIVAGIRNLVGPPLCDIEVVLASQPNVVEVGFYNLYLRAATYDSLYVEADLTIEQIFVEPISVQMTPERFPGMF